MQNKRVCIWFCTFFHIACEIDELILIKHTTILDTNKKSLYLHFQCQWSDFTVYFVAVHQKKVDSTDRVWEISLKQRHPLFSKALPAGPHERTKRTALLMLGKWLMVTDKRNSSRKKMVQFSIQFIKISGCLNAEHKPTGWIDGVAWVSLVYKIACALQNGRLECWIIVVPGTQCVAKLCPPWSSSMLQPMLTVP